MTVLRKSPQRPKTSLKPLSPLTEQVGHPKYLDVQYIFALVTVSERNMYNYQQNSNKAALQLLAGLIFLQSG